MKYQFVVDDIAYVIQYENSEFSLYADAVNSKKKISKIIFDEYHDFVDDGYVDKVFYIGSLVKTKNPMKVYAHVVSFVRGVVSKKRPYYFTYTANEKKKLSVYTAIATKIADKYGYHLEVAGKKFTFYRKAEGNVCS
jgi:hypothetical protein